MSGAPKESDVQIPYLNIATYCDGKQHGQRVKGDVQTLPLRGLNIALTGPDNALSGRSLRLPRLAWSQAPPSHTATTCNPQKCPGAIGVARGVATAPGGDHMNDSTPTPPDNADAYAALIKPGDAVETPDGEIWVVEEVHESDLALVSAYRVAADLVYADVYEPTRTTIPRALAHKVADARQVRRP